MRLRSPNQPRRTGNQPVQRMANVQDENFRQLFLSAAYSGALQQNVITITEEMAARMDADSINLTIDFRTRLTEVYRDKFQALRALDFVPMLDAPVQQTSDGYIGEFLTKVGTAQLVTEMSTDVPLVTVQGRPFTGKVATYGAAGAWNQLDIFRAAIGQVSIPVETQRAAREAVETKTDELVSLGSAEAGIPGFIRHPEVTAIPFTLGNWGTRTWEQILLDLHQWMGAIHARVGFVESSLPNTVLLPPQAKFVLSGVRNAFGVIVWKQLVEEFQTLYGVTIDVWSRLATANNTGGPRVIAYRRDPKCLGALIPMTYTEFAPQERGFQILIPAMARCGGTVVIEPATITYGDNAFS